MPTNSSRTPSAIRSGRVAPVNDVSSARVKLTFLAFLAGPKRAVLSPVRSGDRRNSHQKIWHTEIRRRSGTYEESRALAVSGQSRHRTTTEDAGVMPTAITYLISPGHD